MKDKTVIVSDLKSMCCDAPVVPSEIPPDFIGDKNPTIGTVSYNCSKCGKGCDWYNGKKKKSKSKRNNIPVVNFSTYDLGIICVFAIENCLSRIGNIHSHVIVILKNTVLSLAQQKNVDRKIILEIQRLIANHFMDTSIAKESFNPKIKEDMKIWMLFLVELKDITKFYPEQIAEEGTFYG